MSIIGLLGLLFVGLKLGGIITWSWLWVTAPFWGGFALSVIVIIGSMAFVAMNNSKTKRRF